MTTARTYDELRARLAASLAAKLEELEETMIAHGMLDRYDREAMMRDVVRDATSHD